MESKSPLKQQEDLNGAPALLSIETGATLVILWINFPRQRGDSR
jgi:hypothetical protein